MSRKNMQGVQWRASNVVRGRRAVDQWGGACLAWIELRRHLLALYSHEMGDSKDRDRRFSKVHGRRMRHNRHMLQQKEFWWNIRRKNVHDEHIEALEQAVQRCQEFSILGDIHHKTAWGFVWLQISPHLSSSWARGFAKVPSKKKYSVITYKCYSWIWILYFIPCQWNML